jgi:hypothetical protein
MRIFTRGLPLAFPISGAKGVESECNMMKSKCERDTRGKGMRFDEDRAITMIVRTRTMMRTWTQGECTPESDYTMTLRGDNAGIFLFEKVDNTKYIRKVKDMKNSPNKENTPCVEQWSNVTV